MAKHNKIIQSLLDQDLYKLTMLQTYYHLFQIADDCEFKFKCRNPGIDLAQFVSEIREELEYLCTLKFTENELCYLGRLDYIKKDFIDFLRLFQLSMKHVQLHVQGKEIDLRFKGPLVYTSMFEIFALAIINEVYFRNTVKEPNWDLAGHRLLDKIALIKSHPEVARFKFTDFGTRRRFSREWHLQVVETLKNQLPDNFVGTSNVYLARELSLTPIGTMAHEFLQAAQAMGPRLIDSQNYALETWVKEYRGRLGIALTDVVGMDAFLRDFDLYFAKLFDGLRHDSGCPFEWAKKAINHYRKLKIDPMSKTLVFSDGLDFPTALKIYDTFKGEANVAFGIGTNLTNDLGVPALNIVIKMTRCRNQPVAKISDSPGKEMCEDDAFLQYLASVFQIKRLLA
ncbi:nicotinate phosphoribosyltransferase [Desulfuromonas soudanensis]|uniref:Nicotinate phosphoribosyltransferase n=1 Tax=Desulfuromonas soudanensis TaxID=1603606 RepID=A0A0M3QGA0_9BACT|nr:nicotinate phosphoribosyltransferase [Desulfuromonas soudanensis]ALC17619.1 nicotinate phosphoribosyltransferase [Desulfuromonas soudanensis]